MLWELLSVQDCALLMLPCIRYWPNTFLFGTVLSELHSIRKTVMGKSLPNIEYGTVHLYIQREKSINLPTWDKFMSLIPNCQFRYSLCHRNELHIFKKWYRKTKVTIRPQTTLDHRTRVFIFPFSNKCLSLNGCYRY